MSAAVALIELRVQRNGLTSLPDSISSLHHLQHLNLHCNQLTALPPTLPQQLSSLESLAVSCNYLAELPIGISALTRLTALNGSHNELRCLPHCVGKMSGLQQLDLYANRWGWRVEGVGVER